LRSKIDFNESPIKYKLNQPIMRNEVIPTSTMTIYNEDNTTRKIFKKQKEMRENKNFVRFVATKQSELFNESFYINEDEYKKYNIGYFFNEYIKSKNY
jgi:hypothetical protein